MSRQSFTSSGTLMSALSGGLIMACIMLSPVRADELTKKTILTVKETTQIDKTVLQPGEYVLRLLDERTDRHVVEIFNREETHIIATVVAVPTERLIEKAKTTFTFYETPAGSVRALRTWYYPGDSYGQKFPYPKTLQAVAAGTQTTVETAAVSTAPAETPAPPAEQEADRQQTTEPVAQAEAAAPAPVEQPAQPVEMAQNTPPPAQTPAAAPSSMPAELPKTGTSYPALGILGLSLLSLAGLLRWREQQ